MEKMSNRMVQEDGDVLEEENELRLCPGEGCEASGTKEDNRQATLNTLTVVRPGFPVYFDRIEQSPHSAAFLQCLMSTTGFVKLLTDKTMEGLHERDPSGILRQMMRQDDLAFETGLLEFTLGASLESIISKGDAVIANQGYSGFLQAVLGRAPPFLLEAFVREEAIRHTCSSCNTYNENINRHMVLNIDAVPSRKGQKQTIQKMIDRKLKDGIGIVPFACDRCHASTTATKDVALVKVPLVLMVTIDTREHPAVLPEKILVLKLEQQTVHYRLSSLLQTVSAVKDRHRPVVMRIINSEEVALEVNLHCRRRHQRPITHDVDEFLKKKNAMGTQTCLLLYSKMDLDGVKEDVDRLIKSDGLALHQSTVPIGDRKHAADTDLLHEQPRKKRHRSKTGELRPPPF